MEGISYERPEGLEISYSFLTTMEMLYLLSNNDGYLDGDKHCLVIPVN